MHFDLTLGVEPASTWRLEASPTATEEQRRHVIAWLGN
jgi:hypothetical protein